MRRGPPLRPEQIDLIGLELAIYREDLQVLQLRLGNEKTVVAIREVKVLRTVVGGRESYRAEP